MSTQPHSKEHQMATTQSPATDAPTLPTNTHPWPAFDREHDPEPLVTNDPTPTDGTTLADFGGVEPTDPDRLEIPIDSRDQTQQTSVFRYPRKWWRDADRLAHLFDERGLEIAEISALFGSEISYEVVRSNLNDLEIRDPNAVSSGTAAFLESANPGDVGDPLPDAFDDPRGERA